MVKFSKLCYHDVDRRNVDIKVNIYCPKCKKKLLGKLSYPGTHGKIYLWCKLDKQEVEINLDKIEPRNIVESHIQK